MTQNIKQDIKDFFFKVEGGAVKNKDDLGGATGAGGITMSLLEEYKTLWSKYNFTGNYKKVPMALTMEIFDFEFWNPLHLNEISKISFGLATLMYGWGLNSGVSRPAKALQTFLTVTNRKGTDYPNLVPDGHIGNKTIAALNSYIKTNGQSAIHRLELALAAMQFTFYIDISKSRSDEKNETFTNGWLNRIEDTRYFIESYKNK